MIWLWILAALLLVGLLGWLLVITEGTYLGARAVAALYNLYARRYDAVKNFDPGYEEAFLGRPLRHAIGQRPMPLVLDVATGTGRVPGILLKDPAFRGKVFALDFARDMLAVATARLPGYKGRLVWLWQNAMHLPFPDNRFDLVTCIEALEFMPDPQGVLAEMVRVLQPGGWLLITRRRGWHSRLFPGKAWSKAALMAELHALGLRELRIHPWQVDYDLVWASKPGRPGTPLLPESGWEAALLRCPSCGGSLAEGDRFLSCSQCQLCYHVGERLVELAAPWRCGPDGERPKGDGDGETDNPPGRR